ncbi:MAG: NAD(P)-dependent oxidoreductase, partial [Gallionella sp.]
FLITDILRAIRDNTVLQTSSDFMVRDYLHPSDFYGLVTALLKAPAGNAAVDCYSIAAVDKPTLLATMQEKFGLQYEINTTAEVNATGRKPHYYSLNQQAAAFGYQPSMTALESVVQEANIALRNISNVS